MKINFLLENILDFNRFVRKSATISDLIKYSVIFLLFFAAALLFLAFYIFYLYFFESNFPQDEKTVISFSETDYKRAVQIVTDREKIFNDIAAENKAGSPNPFR